MFALKLPDAEPRRRAISTAGRTAAALDPALGRASYLFNATIAGIEAADAVLIVGANPRSRGAASQRPHPQALAARRLCRSALIGERVDLTYPVRISRRRAGDAGASSSAASADFDQTLKAAKKPLIIVGQGALARPDGRGGAVAPQRGLRAISARCAKAGTASASCITPPRASAALDLGFVPGEGGLDARRNGEGRRARCRSSCSAPTRSTCAARRLRHLSWHARRRRRAPRRRDPARRGLHREVRHSTSTPKGRVQMGERAPRSRPAMRARTGRSCGRFRTSLGRTLPFDSLAAAARAALCQAHPHLAHIDAVKPASPDAVSASPPWAATLDTEPFRSARSPTSTSPTRSPAHRAVMAECSALAPRRRLEAAE